MGSTYYLSLIISTESHFINCFFIFGGHEYFGGATDTPVLDFGGGLLLVSKSE